MSSTITIPGPSRRQRHPQALAGRACAGGSLPGSVKGSSAHSNSATTIKRRKKKRTKQWTLERRITNFINRVENWVHYVIAAALSCIAVATMASTTLSLITTTHSFAYAVSDAVAGVLIVLILIEIARTAITPLDSMGGTIRKLLTIAIISVLREVLWIGVNASSGNSSNEIEKPVAMAISTAVVVGLTAAFVLLRRDGGGK